MKLKNNKQKIITVVYQGKKSIVYPGQIIDGPIQLTIYGLVPVTTEIEQVVTSFSNVEKSKYLSTLSNISDIDKTLNYIKHYNKYSLPTVAICILSKDSYNLISDCINSIEQHVEYKNLSIYVFDTGTTDNKTIDFYNNKKVYCKFPFTVINVGEYHYSKNYNLGLKQVKTDYYVIQNNDTVALNDYITRLIRIAIVNKVGACGPRMLYKDGLIQHDGQVIYDHPSKGFGNPTHVNLKRNPSEVTDGLQPADGITCAGMFVRSTVYWEVGGLNEKYHDIFQDVELNIKIRMNGHMIMCDRNSLINHYDNTSRNSFWANNHEKLKLKHLDYSFLYSQFNKSLKYLPREKKKFSIVTVVNNENTYSDLLNDLKNQDCNFEFEIIALPNFNGEYTSCSNALNIGLSLSESEYVILCHQDIRVPSTWLNDILEKIKVFIMNDVNFGVLGIAGCWSYKNDSNGIDFLTGNTHKIPFKEVQCLDELCLIVKNNSKIKFDEINFPHFHCYGSDLCLQYLSKGYRNFAINTPCVHLSDGFKNLMIPEQLGVYVKNSVILYKKWRHIIPDFRNTTTKFSRIENSITFFVSDELGKRGIFLKKHVVLSD